MVVTVTFTEVENGAQVRLVHSNIPDTKLDEDDLRNVVRGGWTAAFDKLAVFIESREAA